MRLLALILFLAPVLTTAQTIEVREQTDKMSLGSKPGFYVFIPGADEDDVEKAWKKLMKRYDAKTNSHKNELFADEAEISSLNSTPVDVYAVIKEDNGGTGLHVFYYVENDFLSGSNAVKATAAKEIVRQFALEQAKEAVRAEIDASEKALKNLNKDYKDLDKNKKDLEEDIKDCEKAIQDAKIALKKNESDTKAMERTITDQEAKLKELEKKLENVR